MKKFLLIALVISACSSPKVFVKKDADIKTLRIYVDSEALFESDDKHEYALSTQIEREVDDFIFRYNNQNRKHPFILERAESANDPTCLRIKLFQTKLVSSGQQAAGVAVTMIGLSLPFVMISAGSPIYIFFYYFPQAKSVTEYSLTNDISDQPNTTTPFLLTSPGFLKSEKKQIEKHSIYFGKFLEQLVNQVEKGYKRK